jgi:carbonic anhydrase/acetyltransferase-like protein (isoleucine patch superfamily)
MPLYTFNGAKPQLGDGAWIAPSADLIGNVVLGPRVTVLFGAVLRADNSAITIGAETNVQDGSVLHSDEGVPLTIGERVTIGHKVILHGCTIEDNVLIGMGSTILNRAVIGAESLVGANALVTEGKVFPPGSLIIGSPAKVARPLSAEERAAIRKSAAGYVARGAEFAAGLEQIAQASGPE